MPPVPSHPCLGVVHGLPAVGLYLCQGCSSVPIKALIRTQANTAQEQQRHPGTSHVSSRVCPGRATHGDGRHVLSSLLPPPQGTALEVTLLSREEAGPPAPMAGRPGVCVGSLNRCCVLLAGCSPPLLWLFVPKQVLKPPTPQPAPYWPPRHLQDGQRSPPSCGE